MPPALRLLNAGVSGSTKTEGRVIAVRSGYTQRIEFYLSKQLIEQFLAASRFGGSE